MNNINLSAEIETILRDTINPLTAQEIEKYQNIENGTLDLILNLCQHYINYINLETASITLNKYGTKTAKIQKKNHKYTWKQLNIYGARIIYLIRYLITQEEISFLMGVSNGKTTKQRLISQFEIMANLKAVSKTAIGVRLAQLEEKLKVIDDNEFLENKRINRWNLVQKLATVERYNGLNYTEIDAHKIYQNQKMDNLVWVKFSGAKKQRNYYYDLNNSGNADEFIFYNLGWLWQWYNGILRGDDDNRYLLVDQELNKGRIGPIIDQQENIAGTKTGDIQTSTGQQIQTKLNNEQIISYNNIKVILIELFQALSNWKASNKSLEEQEKLAKVLEEHFFPDGVLLGNEEANIAFDQIISNLQSGLIKTVKI